MVTMPRLMLLLGLATVLACAPSQRARRRTAVPAQRTSAAEARGTALRLNLSHIVDRDRFPRHEVFLNGSVTQDAQCRGLGARPTAVFGGVPVEISAGGMVEKDTLNFFGKDFQCSSPYLSTQLEAGRVRDGRLEIRGQGVRILAEHPFFRPRQLVDDGGPAMARPGQRFTLRWLAPGVVPRHLHAEVMREQGASVEVEVQLVGDQLQLTLPSSASAGPGVLLVRGDLDGAFSRCEGIPACNVAASFADKRPFTVGR